VDVHLPIDALRPAFLEALARGPVVISSPTGSGKSTEVPRWCAAAPSTVAVSATAASITAAGRVLVVEPRRVACRSLAPRVADLEETKLGHGVGYVVRDESALGPSTRIVFATPGIVLRNAALLQSAATVVLDEFHERVLDLDLLLALLIRQKKQGLVVMSATLEGERVARHVGGAYLAAEGRTFPVVIRHLASANASPDANNLPTRIREAVVTALADPGDILVFLPGKAEIDASRQLLVATPLGSASASLTVASLHGGLTLDEQRRVLEPGARRKIILATNVAETSLTIPGVGVVVDAGLVRQTRYHDGRSSLVLAPIAQDAAAQRTGRAGRTAPGTCYRLWGPRARLAESTLPEIYRESLVPLVMSAAAWGERPEDLPLLDPPKADALEAARADLDAWGALGKDGALSEGGRDLFALPVEPALARLLVEARRSGCLDDAIDLVAALSVGRPLFLVGPAPEDPASDLRLVGCDATALVRAVRIGTSNDHRVSGFVVEEARRARGRLRRAHDLPALPLEDAPFDREAVARAAIVADPRVVHIARSRGRELAFSNGGTELELSQGSAVRRLRQDEIHALVVFESRAFGKGKDAQLRITCASQIPLSWIARSGLGRDRLGAVRLESGRIVATVERVYAKRVVETRDEVPSGDVARAAIAELFTRGSLFRKSEALSKTRERLALRALAAKLAERGHPAGIASATPIPSLEEWVLARVTELGVETGDDLALLSADDLVAPDLPFEVRSELVREFPRTVSVGDATYEADYDLDRGQVVLRMVKGTRRAPPPLAYLPRFAGLRICVDDGRGIRILR
jgi:ATP-dependent helicase HrpB